MTCRGGCPALKYIVILKEANCKYNALAQETSSLPYRNAPQAAPGQKTATPASAGAQGSPPAPPTRQAPHGRMTATPVSVVLLAKLSARRKCVQLQQVVVSLLALARGDRVPSLSATMGRPTKAVHLGLMEA